MFVRSSEEVVGSPADLLFADAELLRQGARMGTAPIFADICEAAVGVGDERQPWHFQRPDGELRSMMLTLTSVTDEHGGPAGYLCVGEDVTEREAVHRALLEAVAQLTELEQVKADFVATVSHELRTPLTSMIGYLELLDDGEVGELSVAQRSLTGRVQRNSRRLLLLVEDLLLLSQIENRQLTMQPRSLDLRSCVTASLESMAATLGRRELEVVSRLPQVAVTLEGDPEQLERMLVNLLSNAVKFTPDGGRVELVVGETTDSVELTVIDTGMGIPEAEQAQLFTRFFRASSANAQAIQGAGLGLTIVQAVVEAHGGQVTVSSSEGVGTTVSVSLPRTLPAAPAADRDQSATPYRRSPASPSPGTM
jgi:signal transduction histidine kinase